MNAGWAALFSWQIEPVPAFALALAGGVYLRGWAKLSRAVPARFPAWRALCFLCGLAAIAAALFSPLDAFASMLLLSHMTQHILLTMVAPPLIWLGSPQLPLLVGLPRKFVSEGLGPFLSCKSLVGFVHRITNPAVAWVLFVLSNVLWHIPGFYDLALGSRGWHEFEHACFLGTALLFWWHVVQPWPSRPAWPRWAMIPYLLFADIQNTALAAFISFHDGVLYATYEGAPRLFGFSAADDQAGAGALMWVPGSMAFLLPAGFIAMGLLSSKRRKATHPPIAVSPQKIARPPQNREVFDLLHLPVAGTILRHKSFRRILQFAMLAIAALVVADGFWGPQVSAMNAAGVLPWTYWRAFAVVALLVFGNAFCMACPFTLVRDWGRKILPARAIWPKWVRAKWLAAGILVAYLWAYEAFDLWDRPAVTALLVLGYFAAAFLVDGFFRGASFCQYVCPIGQFHFVQSLFSPFEVKVRKPDACAECKTRDCLRGGPAGRGCELHLFQPAKRGNMDCTFCLDCVSACPHQNVGILAVPPGRDLIDDPLKSTVGNYAKRPDIAALALVLTFGAFANAAGMVAPFVAWMDTAVARAGFRSDMLPLAALALIVLVAVPFGSGCIAARIGGGSDWKTHFGRFGAAMAPLGFGMWLAHFLFHFLTAALTPLPVAGRILNDLGLSSEKPAWGRAGLPLYGLPAMEIVFLNAGYLACLYVCWRIAGKISPASRWRAFLPWAAIATALYAAGIWVIFQPMQMRGTLVH